MSIASFHLVRDALDHEVVDVDGTPCGIVDDVELIVGPGPSLRAVALLIGPGAAASRLPKPLAWLVRRTFGSRTRRIPWARVARIDERVVLDAPASALGLDRTQRRWSRWLERIPGA